MSTEILLTIIVALCGAIGFFVKRIMDNTDGISVDVADMKPKVSVLWEKQFSLSRSPRQLNDLGTKILTESGIKEIIEAKTAVLLKAVKLENPTNPYDAEKVIAKVMQDLPKHCPEVMDDLKDSAFRMGTTLDAILFTGSIFLRNLIFPDLGFILEDLDEPKAGT